MSGFAKLVDVAIRRLATQRLPLRHSLRSHSLHTLTHAFTLCTLALGRRLRLDRCWCFARTQCGRGCKRSCRVASALGVLCRERSAGRASAGGSRWVPVRGVRRYQLGAMAGGQSGPIYVRTFKHQNMTPLNSISNSILSNNLSISYHLCAREVYTIYAVHVQHMHKPTVDPRAARARRAAYCTGLLVTRRGAGYPRAISQRSRASRVRATPGVRYAASAGAAGEGGCVTACVIGECTRLGSRPPRSRALGGRGWGDEGGGVGGARVGSHRAEGCGGAVEPEGARGGDGVL